MSAKTGPVTGAYSGYSTILHIQKWLLHGQDTQWLLVLQNLEAGVSCSSFNAIICCHDTIASLHNSKVFRSNGQHWETCVSYTDYPCDLAIAPLHCFTALHNPVWPLQIAEIQLGMQVQLNFSCLCKGHTGVWSILAELLTVVQALLLSCENSACTIL